MFGSPLELGAENRVLRCHADRTGIEMALAHHDAAFGHQRRRREAELIGPQERADDHIAPGFHLAVGLHPNASEQIDYLFDHFVNHIARTHSGAGRRPNENRARCGHRRAPGGR